METTQSSTDGNNNKPVDQPSPNEPSLVKMSTEDLPRVDISSMSDAEYIAWTRQDNLLPFHNDKHDTTPSSIMETNEMLAKLSSTDPFLYAMSTEELLTLFKSSKMSKTVFITWMRQEFEKHYQSAEERVQRALANFPGTKTLLLRLSGIITKNKEADEIIAKLSENTDKLEARVMKKYAENLAELNEEIAGYVEQINKIQD